MMNVHLRRAMLCVLPLAFSAFAGCKQDSAEAPAAESAEPAAATKPAEPVAAAATGTDESALAVPEDFEQEVEQSITADNYKAELATLEAELQQ